MTASIASRLQLGQRDSVLRGTPAATGIRSLLLSSGPGAQSGCGILTWEKDELTRLDKVQAAFDATCKTWAGTVDMWIHLRCEIYYKGGDTRAATAWQYSRKRLGFYTGCQRLLRGRDFCSSFETNLAGH